jgi:phage repressor protein C with HTH and peptisase S24 domain
MPSPPQAMLTHAQIWAAIDALATRAGLSPSGLARRAGLDPTTFNKSKRVTPDGRERWPSTESVAKCLAATTVSIDQFVGLIAEGSREAGQTIPVIGFAQAADAGYFDEGGIPSGKGWDEIAFPALEDKNAYALEISGDAMLPVYRDGTFLIVSPQASIRRGDRVVLKTRGGEVIARELKRKTSRTLELKSLTPGQADRTFTSDEYLWLARIVWASQ